MIRDIQLRQFNEEDLSSVYRLIQNTVDISYHGVYPIEAIEAFQNHHSEEQILSDAATGYTVVAESNNEILGTGTLYETNVRRVYISPHHQHKGIGRLIVEELEKKARTEKLTTLDLGASLVSRQFWESLGFVVKKEDYMPVRNNQKLHFFWMVKTI